MRVETNDRLVRRSRQIAQYLFFISMGVLVAGLFVTNTQAMNIENPLIGLLLPFTIMPLAFACVIVSIRMTNLWVRQPRPEDAIRESLKGTGNKPVLYNYYHLPSRHVLIAPQGVFAITPRFQDGRFRVENDRWTMLRSPLSRVLSLLRFDGIGNPHADALRAAQHIQALIAPFAPDVPVQPLIVFVDPRAEVEVIGSSIPVLYAGAKEKRDPNLKDYLRDLTKQPRRPTLTPDQIAQFEQATLNRPA